MKRLRGGALSRGWRDRRKLICCPFRNLSNGQQQTRQQLPCFSESTDCLHSAIVRPAEARHKVSVYQLSVVVFEGIGDREAKVRPVLDALNLVVRIGTQPRLCSWRQ